MDYPTRDRFILASAAAQPWRLTRLANNVHLQLFRITCDPSCQKRFGVLGFLLDVNQTVTIAFNPCLSKKGGKSGQKLHVGGNVLIRFHPPISLLLLEQFHLGNQEGKKSLRARPWKCTSHNRTSKHKSSRSTRHWAVKLSALFKNKRTLKFTTKANILKTDRNPPVTNHDFLNPLK